jgi:hypothetical protein
MPCISSIDKNKKINARPNQGKYENVNLLLVNPINESRILTSTRAIDE